MNDQNAPATKGDLQAVKTELQAEMQQLRTELRAEMQEFRTELRADMQLQRTELRAEMQGMEDRLIESYRDGQTELLRAFYSYTKSSDARMIEAEVANHTLRQRVSAVESRVTEVEKRLNMPPMS